MNANDLNNITDPSDFKSTKLRKLSELDILKRCFICKDFLKAPVTTSCHHTYCSQCIREHLLNSTNCPICKCEIFESNLRADPLLEEIVRTYKLLRPQLLSLLKKEEPQQTDEIIELDDKSSDTPVIHEHSEGDSVRVETPPVVSEDSQTDDVIEIKSDDDPNLAQCPVCQEKMNIEVLQRNHIEDCLSGKRSKRTASDILYPRKKQTRHNGSITSFFRSSPSSNENVSTSPPPPPASPSKPAPSPPPPPQPQQVQQQQQVIAPPRLPKLDFNSLTTPKVKAKLKELHLSTSGTRPELERRYNQYFVFVNANIDSSHPVSGEVLRDRLNKWERTFKFRAKDSIDSDADWKNLIAKAKQTKQ